MTRVEEAKAALWGQLIDSGEQKEEEANELLDSLISAARAEGAEQERIRILTFRDHTPHTADDRCALIPFKAFCPPASVTTTEGEERDEPPDPMEEIADKYF